MLRQLATAAAIRLPLDDVMSVLRGWESEDLITFDQVNSHSISLAG